MDPCKRGCRFYSIMELVYCNHNNQNLTQQGCIASCEEAYNKSEELDACTLGCKSQVPHVVENQSQDDFMDMMYPLMYVHSVYSSMLDRMYSGMSASWSVYANNQRIIIVKSQPQFFAQIDSTDTDDEYNTANYFETNLDSVDGSATPVLKNSQILGFGDSMEMSQSQDERNSSDWLSCVSKKTGMPRLILSLILLSCAVMMIWLCLTAAVTSPDHRIKQESKKLSINGDLEYLREQEAMGVRLLFPQEKLDADPLPIKIKVQRL